jgi:hypothetical protein
MKKTKYLKPEQPKAGDRQLRDGMGVYVSIDKRCHHKLSCWF